MHQGVIKVSSRAIQRAQQRSSADAPRDGGIEAHPIKPSAERRDGKPSPDGTSGRRDCGDSRLAIIEELAAGAEETHCVDRRWWWRRGRGWHAGRRR